MTEECSKAHFQVYRRGEGYRGGVGYGDGVS